YGNHSSSCTPEDRPQTSYSARHGAGTGGLLRVGAILANMELEKGKRATVDRIGASVVVGLG
ncbi:MAG: hypothetical protein ACE1Y4_18990, partial [Lysobacterales bacterium]